MPSSAAGPLLAPASRIYRVAAWQVPPEVTRLRATTDACCFSDISLHHQWIIYEAVVGPPAVGTYCMTYVTLSPAESVEGPPL